MYDQSPQPDPRNNSAEHANDQPNPETEPKRSPAIYVVSLADYNNGILHGTWIDAARDPAHIRNAIDALLASSREPGAEEWAIHDYEQFGRCRIHEHDDLELVSRIAHGIEEHGYAFSAWADVHEGSPDRFDDFTDVYIGHYASLQAYAEQLADDLGYTQELARLPEAIQPYVRIDTAAMASDLELSSQIYVAPDPNGGVWLFDGTV